MGTGWKDLGSLASAAVKAKEAAPVSRRTERAMRRRRIPLVTPRRWRRVGISAERNELSELLDQLAIGWQVEASKAPRQ